MRFTVKNAAGNVVFEGDDVAIIECSEATPKAKGLEKPEHPIVPPDEPEHPDRPGRPGARPGRPTPHGGD